METVRSESTSRVPAGAVALGLAVCAAASLTVAHLANRGTAPDELVSLGVVLGFGLLAWAAIVAVAGAVHLLRGARDRRPAAAEILLVAATGAAIAGILWAYPPFGGGGGAA